MKAERQRIDANVGDSGQTEVKPILRFLHVKKVFPPQKPKAPVNVAVADLCLDMYVEHITFMHTLLSLFEQSRHVCRGAEHACDVDKWRTINCARRNEGECFGLLGTNGVSTRISSVLALVD